MRERFEVVSARRPAHFRWEFLETVEVVSVRLIFPRTVPPRRFLFGSIASSALVNLWR